MFVDDHAYRQRTSLSMPKLAGDMNQKNAVGCSHTCSPTHFPLKHFERTALCRVLQTEQLPVALWAKTIPYVLKSLPNQTCWIFSPCQITDRSTWFQTCLGNKSQLLACFGPTNQKLSQIDMWHIRKIRRRMSPPKNNNKVIRS